MKAFHKETQGSLISNFKYSICRKYVIIKLKPVAGTNSGDLIRKQEEYFHEVIITFRGVKKQFLSGKRNRDRKISRWKDSRDRIFYYGKSNSRNRVFVEDGEGIRTQAFDPSKLEDPSLIIYAPVRVLGNKTIVTNGDQTDTIYAGMDRQQTFEQSLRCREFEPDGPNYTPRISGIMHIENGNYNFAMSILKSSDGNPESCSRFTYAYEKPLCGEGRFIHTYMNDGNPLPSFEGEPKRVAIEGDIDSFTENVWESLNEDNKVSLFVRFIDIETGKYETRIVNKNH